MWFSWTILLVIFFVLFLVIFIATQMICGAVKKVGGLRFSGSKLLIIGGSEGIGLGLAKIGIKKGCELVIIASRSMDKLEKAHSELEKISKENQKILILQCDVTNKNDIAKLVYTICVEKSIELDYIFLNQGLTYPTGYFLEHSLETLEKFSSTNYLGTVYVLRMMLPYLLKQKNEIHIGIVGSAMGFLASVGFSAYTPTKFALRGLAETLENEFLGSNVHFHYALPVDTDTPGFSKENENKPEEAKLITSSGGLLTSEECAVDMFNCMQKGNFYLGSSFQQTCLVTSGRCFGPQYGWVTWEYVKICFFGGANLFFCHDWAQKSLYFWPKRKEKFEELVRKEFNEETEGKDDSKKDV